MDTFFGPYFDFCLELALETWAKASLTQSLWVRDPYHTHLLASFQWSGLSDQRGLHLTECCLQVQKWCLYKGRGVVPEPVCANKVRNGPASADQGFSTASQGSCHVHGTPCWNPPTSPYPAFFTSSWTTDSESLNHHFQLPSLSSRRAYFKLLTTYKCLNSYTFFHLAITPCMQTRTYVFVIINTL